MVCSVFWSYAREANSKFLEFYCNTSTRITNEEMLHIDSDPLVNSRLYELKSPYMVMSIGRIV